MAGCKGWVIGVVALMMSAMPAWAEEKVAATTTAPVKATAAELTSLIPVDAWVAVVSNNISTMSQKIDTFSVELGTSPMNLEEELLRKLGLGKGISMTAPAALLVLNNMLFPDQPYAILLPVEDFAMLTKLMQAKPTETPGILEGNNPEMDGTCFVAKKGSYVVVGATEAVVKAVISSTTSIDKTMSPASRELMAKSDLFAHVNIQALVAQYGPMAKSLPMLMAMGAMSQTGAEEGEDGPSAEAMAEQQAKLQAMQQSGKAINAFVELLEQMTVMDLGLNFDEKQMRMAMVVSFKPGSELATAMKAEKASTESLLKGLPGPGFTFALGSTCANKSSKFQMAMVEASANFADPNDKAKYMQVMKDAYALYNGTAMQLALGTPKPGKPALQMQSITRVADAKKYVELTKSMMELTSKMTMPGATSAPAGEAAASSIKYEPAVGSVAGVMFDRVTMDIKAFAGSGMNQMPEMMQTMLSQAMGSKDGLMTYRIGILDSKTILTDMTGDDEALKTFITSVRSGAMTLAKNAKVSATSAMLSKTKTMECYIDLGQVLSMMMSGALMSGEPTEGEEDETMPAVAIDVPLVGVSTTVIGEDMGINMVLPTEVLAQLRPLAGMLMQYTDKFDLGGGIPGMQ